jgi:hypothetical protein
MSLPANLCVHGFGFSEVIYRVIGTPNPMNEVEPSIQRGMVSAGRGVSIEQTLSVNDSAISAKPSSFSAPSIEERRLFKRDISQSHQSTTHCACDGTSGRRLNERSACADGTEGLDVRVVHEDGLNYLCPKFWIPDPLEFSE